MCAQNPINGPGILRGSREGTNSLCKISKKKWMFLSLQKRVDRRWMVKVVRMRLESRGEHKKVLHQEKMEEDMADEMSRKVVPETRWVTYRKQRRVIVRRAGWWSSKGDNWWTVNNRLQGVGQRSCHNNKTFSILLAHALRSMRIYSLRPKYENIVR